VASRESPPEAGKPMISRFHRDSILGFCNVRVKKPAWRRNAMRTIDWIILLASILAVEISMEP
jgi:hypothetical protein